jgi:hypothetical protein
MAGLGRLQYAGCRPLIIDRSAPSRLDSQILLIISLLHAYQGMLTLIYHSSVNATSLLIIAKGIAVIPDIGISATATGALMLASAAAAIAGTIVFVRLRSLMFAPQQILLGAMAWGGIFAMLRQHYLDGTAMDWPHISADQSVWISLFLIHALAMVSRCRA